MEIKDFEVEQWMNLWETKCTHNVAETCVYSLSLDQLFELTGGDSLKTNIQLAYNNARAAAQIAVELAK